MLTIDQKGRITRRRFFEFGTGALATTGVLAGVKVASAAHNAEQTVETARPDSAPIMGKIALEEHFSFSETVQGSYGASGTAEFRKQIEDIGAIRIAEMDRGGVELCILSLLAPKGFLTLRKLLPCRDGPTTI